MLCNATGLPKPKIIWYKDDVIFEPKGPRIIFEDNEQIIIFNETLAEDQGIYKCEAVNKYGSDCREIDLRFKNVPEKSQWLIYAIIFLVIALVASVMYLIVRIINDWKLRREMRLLGLTNFEKGAIENINPAIGINDQAEFLPYDKKWEFPREQLKLGEQLGSGAFGVVLKGEAKYIIKGEPITTVAVKTLKKNSDNIYLKALASELKIMVHLGKHLNIVNLLGACTKNVAKRELLVIVEYCRFGNLQNYLLKHREHFINQIDPQTGEINNLIGEELLDKSKSMSSNNSNINSSSMAHEILAVSDPANDRYVESPSAMSDYRISPNCENVEMTLLTQDDDCDNKAQPEWRSNYKGVYKENVDPISTRDLIIYAFQIARGMEYLASRKVLHGDLAARNILLSEDNIVKICDFGLAKSMYKSENYRKRGDCPLPVKWMAIESIRDGVFSTQSDCWSLGIVLWELFSLGRTPYPGIPPDESLYRKLVDGYRLESPELCPKEIYQIMTECWSVQPTSRPSFTKLTERIGSLIEDTVKGQYVDLNDPYLAMNTKILDDDGYLKPNTIANQRIEKNNVENEKNRSSEQEDDVVPKQLVKVFSVVHLPHQIQTDIDNDEKLMK